MTEIWKDVEGYEGFYQVSNKGRVKSLDRLSPHATYGHQKLKGTIIKLHLRAGYPFVRLSVGGSGEQVHVHRLVAQAFCEKPPGCDVVNHLDSNRENNDASNLEWTTTRGNFRHAMENGRWAPKRGEDAGAAKLKNADIDCIRQRILTGERYRNIARDYGVGVMVISDIKRGSRWSRVGDPRLLERCESCETFTAKGSEHHGAKLSEDDVQEIIRLLCDKIPQVEISEISGASRATVSNINLGYSWSHVRVPGIGDPPYYIAKPRQRHLDAGYVPY